MYRSMLESEIRKMLGKVVGVRTLSGKDYRGILLGIEPTNLNLILGDVKGNGGESYYRLILNNNNVAEIFVEKGYLDLKKLSERLERIFPKMVTYNEQAGIIIVMDKIRVDETGVIEGSGLAAERVKKVYEEFVREEQASQL